MKDFVALEEDMAYPIEPELDGDLCGSTSINEPVVCTIIGANWSMWIEKNIGVCWPNKGSFGRLRTVMLSLVSRP
jgi:hypothetical protein